jgi:hypothetical protein
LFSLFVKSLKAITAKILKGIESNIVFVVMVVQVIPLQLNFF